MASHNRAARDPPSLISSTYPPNTTTNPLSLSPSDHHLLLDPSSTFLQPHPSSAPNSHPNSFQNDPSSSFLSDFPPSSNDALDFGFSRPDFRHSPLSGSVQLYQRHVFLCYKNPSVWPPRIEAAEFDRLPRLLSAALVSRNSLLHKETRLTICEGHDGTETSNGDVLIFPDMIRYRRLTHFDVDTFVEEVLVKDGEWLPGTPEKLKGSYVFICSHVSRDRRCGVCGPALVSRFREEIELQGLQGKVSVSPCSHIGGHKYAGNVIIFGPSTSGAVTGHWYGYVTPEDVPILLEQHLGKGEIVEWLWRGQMGLSEEEQIKAQELRLQMNRKTNEKESVGMSAQRQIDDSNNAGCLSQGEFKGCCKQNGNSSCCQNPALPENSGVDAIQQAVKLAPEKKKSSKNLLSRLHSGKGSSVRRRCAMPTWFESWEREDTYAVLAVGCAAVSVAVAYSCYKQLQ